MTDEQLLQALKNNDSKALREIYLTYKEPFLAYANGFSINQEDAVDVFQDTVLALRENVSRGKLTKLNSSLKTYLFSIGKYMIYDSLRAKKKWLLIKQHQGLEEASMPNEFDVLFREPLDDKEVLLEKAFKELGEKCKQVLTLFYYKNLSLDQIKTTLNYSNKDVLKSQKSRCLKTLKKKMDDGR